MQDTTITALPTASGIDGSVDWLAIDRTSVGATQKINRNTLLGVTGQPMDISSNQSVTNKTFDNTNVLSIRDDRFTLQDNSDTTKQAQFQLSGLSTATIRTYTLPNRSSTIATLDGTQIFTGANSFTGSSWSGGTIDNSTVTVDSVAGHTSANSGTIYGMSVTSGTIGSAAYAAGSVSSATIATNGIAASNLATNAITLGYTAATNTSGSFTTIAQQTAFNTTVTIPSGGRKVKVTVYVPDVYVSTNGANVIITLWSGTFNSGNPLNTAKVQGGSTGGVTPAIPVTFMAVHTPSAGSITYSVGMASSSGTGGWQANDYTTSTAFLLVEAI